MLNSSHFRMGHTFGPLAWSVLNLSFLFLKVFIQVYVWLFVILVSLCYGDMLNYFYIFTHLYCDLSIHIGVIKEMMNGRARGKANTTPQLKCIKLFDPRMKAISCSNGSRRPPTDLDTRFSFGFYFMTDLTTETCWEGNICI